MQELDAFYNQLIHLSLFGIKVKIIIPRNKIAKLEEFLAENGKNSLLMMTWQFRLKTPVRNRLIRLLILNNFIRDLTI